MKPFPVSLLRHGFTAGLILSTFACSSLTTAQNTPSTLRTIASTSASVSVEDNTVALNATTNPVPKPQTFSFGFGQAEIRSGSLQYRRVVDVPLVLTTPQAYTISVDDFEMRDVWETIACEKKVVKPGTKWSVDPAKRHPAWKALATANDLAEKATTPKSKAAAHRAQVEALAEAVDEIGDVSAEKLIDGNYFTHQIPKTWNEFTLAIRSAEKKSILAKNVATKVLETSEAENRMRLGYEIGTNFDIIQGTCLVKTGEKNVKVGSHEEVRYKQFEQTTGIVKRDITIIVRGGALLPSETEALDFYVSGEAKDLRLTDSEYNRYQYSVVNSTPTSQIQSGLMVMTIQSTITLQALERIRPAINGALSPSLNLIDAGNGLNLVVTMDESLQDLLNAGALGSFQIRYQVESCKPSYGFLYPCNWDYKVIKEGAVAAKERVQTLSFPDSQLKGGQGWKYRMKVWLDFTNNRFYSGTTPKNETKKVKRE